MTIGLTLGIPLGMIAASKENAWLDKTVSGYAAVSLAVPTFWVGILFILLFGVTLEWLPTASHYIPF